MEPIISPWLIYLLAIADPIKTCWWVLVVVISVVMVGHVIAWLGTRDTYSFKEEFRNHMTAILKKRLPRLGGILLFCVVIAIAIPNRNTIIAILVAQNITPNNINKVVKKGEALKDSIKKDVLDILTAIQRGRDNDRSHPSKQP